MSGNAWSRELRTARLRLRRWVDSDRVAFAAMSADARVMEHFPGLLSTEECNASADRIEAHFERHGFGYWAAELVGVAPFVGFIGLAVPRFEAAFTPCVEVGWRLAAEYWGQGLATEGARAALEFGFENVRLSEIVAFTVPANVRSRRVMEKLGMVHCAELDFDHPMLPQQHPLRRHVFYRITADAFARPAARPVA